MSDYPKHTCKCLCGCKKEFEPYIAGTVYKYLNKETCPDCDNDIHKKKEK